MFNGSSLKDPPKYGGLSSDRAHPLSNVLTKVGLSSSSKDKKVFASTQHTSKVIHLYSQSIEPIRSARSSQIKISPQSRGYYVLSAFLSVRAEAGIPLLRTSQDEASVLGLVLTVTRSQVAPLSAISSSV